MSGAMEAFLPYSDPPSDYANIRINGMWYQEWQGGYDDILKRGYPKPKYKTTILAELHSPIVADFLHGGTGDVPFLVSPNAKAVFRKAKLTGIQFSTVQIAKIATKGLRQRKPRSGEPEDQIIKAQDHSDVVVCPILHAVRVVGRLEIVPEYASGRCPEIDYVTPYDLPELGSMPDLWRPTIRGRIFSDWTYCSAKFRDTVIANNLSNIGFEPFEKHMKQFRREVKAGLSEARSWQT